MSVYDLDDERTIRVGRLVRDWMRSDLLSAEQYERIKPELEVDLRRTNMFLRITLFVFSLLILQSVLGLAALLLDELDERPAANLFFVAAAFYFWLAGHLIHRYRFYRFGIEEAAAVSAITSLGFSAAVGLSDVVPGFNQTMAAGLAGAAAASTAVFLRFGYRYAAIAAIGLVAAVPFQFGHDQAAQRLGAIALLAVVAVVTRIKHHQHGDEHPGGTYALLEAVAWMGIYVLLNVQIFGPIDSRSLFYWPSYGGIWILPLLGLWLSIRGRQRLLLDVSVLMLLATLMSNKAYLGTPPYPWDPLVFGLLLMGGAIAIKRWLAVGDNGERNGFTAARIVVSDKSKVGFFGTVASLARPVTPTAPQPASAPVDPAGGGGRSGGAGSSGSF